MSLYFSRLTLKRDPSTAALRDLIDPKNRARATDAHHRLLWSVFADDADRDRDFLWRAEPRGLFYTLSSRPPLAHGLFEKPQTKKFGPKLVPGDRLAFMLRANATRSLPGLTKTESGGKRPRGKVVDVAMHLLKDVPSRDAAETVGVAGEPSERAQQRHGIARREAHAWLSRQGQTHGFAIDPLSDPAEETESQPGFVLENYQTITVPGYRGPRRKEPRFGVFDMQGIVTVTNPEEFLMQLATGFGRAKAYGCGLMLIRRI